VAAGLKLHGPHDPGVADTIAVLVVVSFPIGIARSWELIGGPTFTVGHEVTTLIRPQREDAEAQTDPAAVSDRSRGVRRTDESPTRGRREHGR
jgi:hypothetical protein